MENLLAVASKSDESEKTKSKEEYILLNFRNKRALVERELTEFATTTMEQQKYVNSARFVVENFRHRSNKRTPPDKDQ